jgi:hypothetical protein
MKARIRALAGRLLRLATSHRRAPAASPIRGHLDRWDGVALSGWAFVSGESAPAAVRVEMDGRLLVTATADLERPDVALEHGEAHRHTGFHIPVDANGLDGVVVNVLVAGRVLKTLSIASRAGGDDDDLGRSAAAGGR